MNNDQANTPRDVRYMPAGPGLFIGKRCDRCGLRKSTQGGKVVRVLWHCAACLNVKGAK